MITGTKEVIGKRVWAYIPQLGGGFIQRQGSVEEFQASNTMYLVKYDGMELALEAQPSWLIFEPKL